MQYAVTDGRGLRSFATLRLIAKEGANVPPTAEDDWVSHFPANATSVDVSVLDNDDDVDGPRSALTVEPIADDSGLEVDALKGAPGVRSARYAVDQHKPHEHAGNSPDEANNARLLRELHDVPEEFRNGRFVCVIAVARNGHTLATFEGHAEGLILHAPRGSNGFGYDPLFFFPQIEKTFAELTAEEKAKYSHRGAAFRQFLDWADHFKDLHPHFQK